MPVEQNKKGGKAVIRMTANGTISLANLQLAGETVRAAYITAVYWTGPWNVVRGANTVLQLTDGQDSWMLEGDVALRDGGDQSLVFSHGTPAGTIIVEVNKITQDEQ
jgi:hypothetical protein